MFVKVNLSSQRPHGYERVDLLRNKIATLHKLSEVSNESIKREGKSIHNDIFKNLMKKTIDKKHFENDEEYTEEDPIINIVFLEKEK